MTVNKSARSSTKKNTGKDRNKKADPDSSPSGVRAGRKFGKGKRRAVKRSHSKSASRSRTGPKNGRVTIRKYIVTTILSLTVLFVAYLVFLDLRIIARFEGTIWQLPAHVYARPLELYAGKSISIDQLRFELEYLNYQEVDEVPEQAAQYRYGNGRFEIRTRDFVFWDGEEPGHHIRVLIDDDRVVQVLDLESGEATGLVRFDAGYLTGIFPAHSQDRVLLKIDEVPDIFIKMLLVIEDRRFFTHHGIDPVSIMRALMVNLYSGEAAQGGSTVTQQLVKNLFLTQDKTLSRKINEALMSLLLELHYDKMLILETYINEIYLGQDGKRSIHGFGLASEFYFGKPLKDLTIDQMAVLVGMVKGASYFNPLRNQQRSRQRRDIILTTMNQTDLITDKEYEALKARPLKTVRHARSGRYPAFIDAVKLQLQQDYDPDDLSSEGLRVYTTLDPYIQKKTESAISSTLDKISSDKKLQSAAVVVSPLSGEVLAVVGDRNPTFKGFNRALNAQRQIGSLIKPAVYLTALEQPARYTLATMIEDSEFVYPIPKQDDWRPQNYDRKYHGDVSLYEALLKSYNIPAARTGIDVGIPGVIRTLSALGYKQHPVAYPSLSLGAVNMSPMEVADIYQTFSANGFHSPLRSVHAVLDKNREPLQRYPLDVDNEVDTQAVALINSVLIDVTKYGTARKLSDLLEIQVAGKTGTSDDLRDSWFAGFSEDIIAVVWTGRDDNQPTGLTGSSGAMRIWSRMMQDIAYRSYEMPVHTGVTAYWIDTNNGLLSEEGCENAVQLYFISGSQPKAYSDCESGAGSNVEGNWFTDLFD